MAAVVVSGIAMATIACGRGEPRDAGRPALGGQGEVAAPIGAAAPQTSGAVPVETGEELYMRLGCAGCHEFAAVPGMMVRPLENLRARYTEEALARFLLAPPRGMPDFGLSEDQAKALAGFVLINFG